LTRAQKDHRARDKSLESEIKFKLVGPADHARLRARLRDLGAAHEATYDEVNVRFRNPGKGASLRLRVLDGGPTGILTTKGPARFEGPIKIREETEVTVNDAQAARDLLESIGHVVTVIYEKHRSSYRFGEVTVTLDVLDFGFFSEVEGPPDQLLATAGQLGLDKRHALRSSYSALARRHRRRPEVVP